MDDEKETLLRERADRSGTSEGAEFRPLPRLLRKAGRREADKTSGQLFN